jgi:hypothetical protein
MPEHPGRPELHLRLVGGPQRDGELSLEELARVAQSTQQLVTRLARGLAGNRTGRPSNDLVDATRLFLVGLRSGSTVLDIAGPAPDVDSLIADGMPSDLGERVLGLMADGVRALSDEEPALPVGLDTPALQDLDTWLRALRRYTQVSLEADLSTGQHVAEFEPAVIRRRLKTATPQPSLPFVSPQYQAVRGRLYALNLRTGSFSIEDDSGHAIRLVVPDEVRERAAQLVNTRVQVIGTPRVDEGSRLLVFDVVEVLEATESYIQSEFFVHHELVAAGVRPVEGGLEHGVIPDLSDDEVDAFLAALSE